MKRKFTFRALNCIKLIDLQHSFNISEAGMTLTEIIDTLKFNFNPSKVIISFEKTMGFYNESDNVQKEII